VVHRKIVSSAQLTAGSDFCVRNENVEMRLIDCGGVTN